MQSLLQRSRRPDLTFYSSGRIDIAARVARKLALRQGDVIDMGLEEDELWLYVRSRAPVVGRHEGTVFRSGRTGWNCRVWSSGMARTVMKMSGAPEEEKIRLGVGEPCEKQPWGTALPIIYKHLIP